MRHLFIIDPMEGLDPAHDSSVAIMEAAQERGDEVWTTAIEQLGASDGRAATRAIPVELQPARIIDGRWRVEERWWDAVGGTVTEWVDDFDFVWMRADPPVDDAYVRATHLLDYAASERCHVINRPAGLRDANEKLYPLRFPELIPDTTVSADAEIIRSFVDSVGGRAVLKPLDGMAGRGIHLLRLDDPNFRSIIETATHEGKTQVLVQEFLPAVADGDRRVIVIGGEPVGVVRRLSSDGDFRCNMAVGAAVERDTVTEIDRKICELLRDDLLEAGLWLVGLDIIGDRLTEINVTSPTGLREIDLLSGTALGHELVDWTRRYFD